VTIRTPRTERNHPEVATGKTEVQRETVIEILRTEEALPEETETRDLRRDSPRTNLPEATATIAREDPPKTP
jgi:hypothetical protein